MYIHIYTDVQIYRHTLSLEKENGWLLWSPTFSKADGSSVAMCWHLACSLQQMWMKSVPFTHIFVYPSSIFFFSFFLFQLQHPLELRHASSNLGGPQPHQPRGGELRRGQRPRYQTKHNISRSWDLIESTLPDHSIFKSTHIESIQTESNQVDSRCGVRGPGSHAYKIHTPPLMSLSIYATWRWILDTHDDPPHS